MERFKETSKTRLKRLPQRGSFDRRVVYDILDEAFVCHVGFVFEGAPIVIPTAYGRVGDTLYIHGSAASRMQRALAQEIPVCVTVTLLDALVLARSAFHHSVNYRSVVIFGAARVVEDPAEKMRALEAFTDHVIAGRWAEVREPNEQELKATTVLAIALEEVSAKIRTGPPKDDEEDMNIPVWAGELPVRMITGTPVPDPTMTQNFEIPDYVLHYDRGNNKA
jgi:hypothetical protein